MDSKFFAVAVVGLLILSVGVSGCTGSNGGNGGSNKPDYSNEYEATYVTAKYTSDISSDNARIIAEAINGLIKQPKAGEITIQQSTTTAYIHKDGEATVVKMETGFSSADEITSTGEELQNDLLDAFKDVYGDNVKLILINESGEEFRTIQ